MSFYRRLLLLFLTLLPLGVAAQLPDEFRRELTSATIPLASVAVVVQGLDAPAPIISHNAQQPMNPASVMKLVTTFAALDLLGPAYTWPTRVLSEAAVRDGVLAGHLYLQGSGDPLLGSEHVWQL